jgi:trk system potassium uptake protein TrkA
VIVDLDPNAFVNLGENFSGVQVTGKVTDEELLKSAGIESADLIAVLTSDEVANLMSAQIARHRFGKENILVRVFDPVKAGAYRELGLKTVCPTNVEFDMILKEFGLKTKKSKGG